jgi:hypothetical protein
VENTMQELASKTYKLDPIRHKAELQRWSCHSLRVGACTILHSMGLTGTQIKWLLQWRSDAFMAYLRNLAVTANQQVLAFDKAEVLCQFSSKSTKSITFKPSSIIIINLAAIVVESTTLRCKTDSEKQAIDPQNFSKTAKRVKPAASNGLQWEKVLHFMLALVITMAKQGVYVQAYSKKDLTCTLHSKFESKS